MTTILDGGIATTLEQHGHDLTGGLWSARLLIENPAAIEKVHREFFAAGAQVATTASYQASTLALSRSGHDPELAPRLWRRSVEVARRARDEARPDGLVAGSMGAFGASLADGSEYSGAYGRAVVDDLVEFHLARGDALLDHGIDLLAFETLPIAAEVEAAARVIHALRAPAWVSLTPAPGGLTTRDGVPLDEAIAPLIGLDEVVAIGVNCCDPADVSTALRQMQASGKPGIAYPNSGELWNPHDQIWEGEAHWRADLPQRWVADGAMFIGGCCRVSPEQIAALAHDLTP